MAAGEHMRAAMAAQADWVRAVPERVGARRFPDGRVVVTGCGTSFHAAQSGPNAIQALEAVLAPPRADLLVAISHEGETELTLEAARAFDGPVWLITGKEESPLAELADDVLVVTPEVEKSWCHTASYVCAVAALETLAGRDVAALADGMERGLDDRWETSGHARWLVAGAGRDWPTAQEAVLKLREGAWVAAEAHQTEQLLHGHLAAVDETVRCFVLEGAGRAAARALQAVAALEELGCDVTLVQTEHPIVDVVRFQALTLDLATARRIDPDWIHRDDERWKRAAARHKG